MTNEIITADWYISLVDDCKAIITEAVFNSRWELILGYHQLGKRIVEDSEYKKWEQGKARRVLTDLSKDVGTGERDLYRAIQFYNKYPDIDLLPEGKNISWNKIVTKYLPKEKPELTSGVTVRWSERVVSSLVHSGFFSGWTDDKVQKAQAEIDRFFAELIERYK